MIEVSDVNCCAVIGQKGNQRRLISTAGMRNWVLWRTWLPLVATECDRPKELYPNVIEGIDNDGEATGLSSNRFANERATLLSGGRDDVKPSAGLGVTTLWGDSR